MEVWYTSSLRPLRLGEEKKKKKKILECGPMPNVIVALPKIGGALCSMPQSLADAHYLTAVHECCQVVKAVEISWGAPN